MYSNRTSYARVRGAIADGLMFAVSDLKCDGVHYLRSLRARAWCVWGSVEGERGVCEVLVQIDL